MVVAAFDTLKVAKRMTDAGMERRQAEEFASVLADQMTADRADLVTKQDLVQTESKLEARIAATEARLEGKISALDTKMEAKFGDYYLRTVTTIIAALGVFFALIKIFP